MKNKDIMKSISLEHYVREVMKIPIAENCPAYNRRKIEPRSLKTAYMRDFSSYRSLCLRESKLKADIKIVTAQLLQAEKAGAEGYFVKSDKGNLRNMFLELGRVSLKKRKLENRCDDIESDFVREIVFHRYFEDLHRKLPSWSQTASELGIAVSGEELRRYVCTQLSAG